MYRVVLLLAVLTPSSRQTNVTESSGTRTEPVPSIVTSTMPPTVFRNNMRTVTNKPRRQGMKQGKSVSSMLNYIFDSYATSNKHFHDRFRAPSFEDEIETNIEADTGSTVIMDCRVASLRDKLVSWLRVSDDENLELLTLDLETYTADSRYKMDLAGDNWRLALFDAKVQDSGLYCCHVSTHPPMLRRVRLLVHGPEMIMTKEAFLETSERLSLKCMVVHLDPREVRPVLRWYRGNTTVPIDEIRSGILVETDLLSLSTHLQVDQLKMEDAGNYTCALEVPLRMKAVARVHVLQGSSLAELQSGVKTTTSYLSLLMIAILLVFRNYGDVR